MQLCLGRRTKILPELVTSFAFTVLNMDILHIKILLKIKSQILATFFHGPPIGTHFNEVKPIVRHNAMAAGS